MKNSIALFALSVSFAASAALTHDPLAGRPAREGSGLAKTREHMLKQSGGFVLRPNSIKGKFAIVDAQSAVAGSNFLAVATHLSDLTHFRFEYVKATDQDVASRDWDAIRRKNDASAVAVVVNDEKLPLLLVAPDDCWAIVNVAKIGKGLATEEGRQKFVPGRARKQIYRVIMYMAGAGTNYRDSALNSRDVSELDFGHESFPQDSARRVKGYLISLGMAPSEYVSYRKACTEGWAAQPTNDIQKAVWDNVHTLPTNPLPLIKPKK